MSYGRLEALITVPTGGWSASANDGTAIALSFAAAATYTPTALAAALVAQLEAGSAQTYTLTVDNGERGTGKITIACTATFSVTWTSTSLRDALGFTGNLSLASSYTATYGLMGMWLPDSPLFGKRPAGDNGCTEGGISQTITPAGVVSTIATASRTRLPPVTWSHVSAARSLQSSEASGVRSFERFMRCVRGTPSYFLPGSPVRLYWDAGTGTYGTFYLRIPDTTDLEPATSEWRGLYACTVEGWAV